ncbi:MAG: acyltransferase family protein [Myxococcales bacterium]|nr:acyltransferase family protein [Myxococcales bacterium]
MGLSKFLRRQTERWVDARLGPEYEEATRALAVRQNEYGFDPFGFHRDSLRYAALIARFFYRDWFRTETFGLEQLPRSGGLLLVANHSGQLPFDGVCIGASMLLDAHPPRLVRTMVERFVPAVPFASYLFNRWGQITGTPDNCRRLLADGATILVFPEGARGISKPFSERYRLQDFGLGFMRLALQANTPIIPVAVIGAEEQAPAVNLKPLARSLGLPAFPVVPFPPFFPLVPLPTRYRLHFGAPLTFTGDPDDDDETITDKVRVVKSSIQSLIQLGLEERKNVFW